MQLNLLLGNLGMQLEIFILMINLQVQLLVNNLLEVLEPVVQTTRQVQ